MVHIDKLTMKDFMCVPEATIEFQKNSAIIITGDNANGKSAVCDALGVCFTEYRRGESYLDFIRKGKAECAVIHLDASINDEPIVFDITLSKKGTPFQRIIKYKTKTYTNSECTSLLESLDMTYFSHVLFSMQGEDNITTLSPTQRAHVLYKLFNYDFVAYLEKVQAKLDELKAKVTFNETQIDFLTKQKFDFQTEDTLPFTQLDYEEKVHSLEVLSARKEAITKIMLANNRVHTEMSQVNKELISRKSTYDIAEERITQHCNNKAKLEAEIALSAETISSSGTRLSTLEDNLKVARNGNATIESQKKNIEATIAELREKIIHYEYDIKDFDRRKALVAEGRCDKCGQETTALISNESIATNVAVNASLKEARNTLAQTSAKLPPLQASYTASTRDVARLEAEIAQCKVNAQTATKKVSDGADRLTALEASYDAIIKNRDGVKKLLDEKQKEHDDLSAKLLVYSEEEMRKVTADASVLDADTKSYSNTLYKNSLVKEANERLMQAQKDNGLKQTEARKIIQETSAIIHTYTEVKTLLEKNLPNYLVVKTCAKLETEINEFIQTVFPNMRVKLYQSKKGVEFFYLPDIIENPPSSEKTSWISVRMASGMEKQALSLAWRVALAKAYNLSILLLDEVDSAASEESSELMFKSLIQNSYFDQLLIITHKKDVKDAIVSLANNACVYLAKKGVFKRII